MHLHHQHEPRALRATGKAPIERSLPQVPQQKPSEQLWRRLLSAQAFRSQLPMRGCAWLSMGVMLQHEGCSGLSVMCMLRCCGHRCK